MHVHCWAIVAGLAVALVATPAAADDELDRALAVIKAVKKEGKGNDDAGPAWKTLVSKGSVALFPTLEALSLAHLRVEGLMLLPPFLPDPETVRPYFRHLAELGTDARVRGLAGPELSMGMSHDFEIAIEEGATFIRVGTALFGPRDQPDALMEEPSARAQGAARRSEPASGGERASEERARTEERRESPH